jgi:GAF domain-containing protein
LTAPGASNNLPVLRWSAIESWFELIWLKRALPFVVIGLIWPGYSAWDRISTESREREENQLALVTAQAWIATAKYRYDQERYLEYRDSLLEAADVPREQMFAFLERREDQPEDMLPFAQKVQRLVDSLYLVEDSIARDAKIRARDSALNATTEPE